VELQIKKAKVPSMVNVVELDFYVDDMKRQPKTANNGNAEGFPERLVTVRKERNLTSRLSR
jgi:hypothetical protein